MLFLAKTNRPWVRRESHITGDIRSRNRSSDLTFRALITPDLLLVDASVVALGCIFSKNVRAVGVIRQELVDQQGLLNHALVNVGSLMSHCGWMLLA